MYIQKTSSFHTHIVGIKMSYSACSERTKRRKIKKRVEEHLKSLEEESAVLSDSSLHNVGELQNPIDYTDYSNNPLDVGLETSVTQCDESTNGSPDGEVENSPEFDDEVDFFATHTYDSDAEDDTSSTGSSDTDDGMYNTKENLSAWATKFNQSHAALAELLEILIKSNLDLPRDPRTLLATPKETEIKNIAGGQYYHFGIQSSIVAKLDTFSLELGNVDTLTLHINIDGLPLHRSSNESLWPILGIIKEFPGSEPCVIGVFSGKSKPQPVHEFLNDFVEEMSVLQDQGLEYDGRKFAVKLDAFICDAPARSFVKCVKGHSGYNGCERCTQHGVWNGKMTFPEVNAPERTDIQFDEMRDEEHHTGASPLRNLKLGLVSQFPLDYMHLVCLGVVRKIILLWTKGPLNNRISLNMIKLISDKLLVLRSHLPREFSRKPRSLLEVRQWKATEFRQFLLYTGPVVLYRELPQNLYENFMLLSVSMSFLLSPDRCSAYSDYVQKLLIVFVKNFGALFGENMLVYNVHSLVHIVQDVKRFGSLDNISAFPFENFLGKLKKIVRRPQHPVPQIVRRIGERQHMVANRKDKRKSRNESVVQHKKPHLSGPLPRHYSHCMQYKQYCGSETFISSSVGDNCFQLGERIVLVRNILKSNETHVVVEEFKRCIPFYDYPISSDKLGVFKVSALAGQFEVVSVSQLSKKFVLLPYKEVFVAFPQLHSQ